MGTRRRWRRGWRSVVAVSLIMVMSLDAACSSGDEKPASSSSSSSSSKARAKTTPTTSAERAAVYAQDGPFQAGSMRIALADGRRVVIWYPADRSAATAPKETLDIAGLLTPELQAKVPADLRRRIQYELDAHPGADGAAGGPFPAVLFSHGYAGFPEQSADLTTHLARWGFVVVAPDHVERSLDGLLGTAGRAITQKLTDRQVLSQSLDAALAENRREASPLEGLVDGENVAVIGHSAGAGAAYETASADRRIKSFISYSVGPGGTGSAAAPPPPPVPGMVMAGTADTVIPVAATREVYRAMRAPKYLVTIRGAGHNVFSDVCLIGRSEGGVVALVRRIGLDIPETLLKLAADGCRKENLDVSKAFPAINHLSVAFLRATLGVDEQPVGLDPQVSEAFPRAGITLSHEG